MSVDLTFTNPLSPLGDPTSEFFKTMLIEKDLFKASGSLVTSMFQQTLGSTQIFAGSLYEALISNTDAATKRPIVIEGVDDWVTSTSKKLKYVLVNGLEPRISSDIRKLYRLHSESNYGEESGSASKIIMNHIMPMRIEPVDLERSFSNASFGTKDKRASINREFASRVLTRKAVSPNGIRGYAEDYYDKSVELMSDYRSMIKTYAKLGLPVMYIYDEASASVGKENTNNLFKGYFLLPPVSDSMLESLLNPNRQGGYGVVRARLIQSIRDSKPDGYILE